jgi:hypothetical protein
LAECLLHIREYYEDGDTSHFYHVDNSTDVMSELTIMNNNLALMLQNNEALREFFRRNDAL